MADISKITVPEGTTYGIKDAVARGGISYYGTCATPAATAAKVITLLNGDDFKLQTGVIVGVNFAYTNTASNVTLNVNNTGALSVWRANGVYTGSSSDILGIASYIYWYQYTGTHWAFITRGGVDNNSNTLTSVYCDTAAGTAAKVGQCTNYSLLANSFLHVTIVNANSYNGAITLNVNGKGAKPIYINGSASSSSNKTLPAGTYLAFYNGTNYYFRTDGKLTADITGSASSATSATTVNGHTVNADVPSGAKFTDTTYSAGEGLSLSSTTFSAINKLVIGTQTAATNAWTGALPTGVSDYYNGLEIQYYLPFAGNSTAATLNLGSKGAKPIYVGNTKNSGVTTHYPAGSLIYMTYVVKSDLNSGNGCWKISAYQNSTYYYESAYCTTAAGTAAKLATCSFFTFKKTHFMLLMQSANTSQTALTLNVNNTGAKPIFINSAASSSSNYTLPAGAYLVYCDGTNYFLRTDGKIQGDIVGNSSYASNAGTVNSHTVNSDVPANAVFTDTTYSAGQGLSLSSTTFSAVNNLVVGTQTAATNVWTGALPTGISDYYNGLEINYYLPFAGNSSAATLNLGSKGAKPVYHGESKNSAVTTHYPAGALLHLVYFVHSDFNSGNGCWKVSNYRNSTYAYESAYSNTAAATAAKVATCSYFVLKKTHFQLLMQYANSASSALTLNVNGTGAKAIYINGNASSSSNKELPAGAYLVYYDGTNYYLRTDGKITGDITGNAATVGGHTVGKDVPSNAIFTDTNNAVTQTNTDSTNADYRILFSATADDTTREEGARKDKDFTYNPSTGNLVVSKLNGVDASSITGANDSVTQTVTTTNANYEVLFSETADNTTHTEKARKNSNFKFNPSTGNLQITQLNGATVGSSPKFSDTTYDAMSIEEAQTQLSNNLRVVSSSILKTAIKQRETLDLGFFEILNTAITTSQANYLLPNSRTIPENEVLTISMYNSSTKVFHSSVTIPASLFRQGYKVDVWYTDTSNGHHWAEVSYVDTTHVKAYASHANTSIIIWANNYGVLN